MPEKNKAIAGKAVTTMQIKAETNIDTAINKAERIKLIIKISLLLRILYIFGSWLQFQCLRIRIVYFARCIHLFGSSLFFIFFILFFELYQVPIHHL